MGVMLLRDRGLKNCCCCRRCSAGEPSASMNWPEHGCTELRVSGIRRGGGERTLGAQLDRDATTAPMGCESMRRLSWQNERLVRVC